MEQGNNENRKGGMCACGCNGMQSGWDCGCGYGHMHIHRHFLLRIILAVIVVAIVFWMGVKVGQFSSFFRLERGYYPNYDYVQPGYPMPIYNGSGVSGGASGVPMMVPTTGSGTVTK